MPTDLPADLPAELPAARLALHQLAAHVLAPCRYAVTGRFGLRAAPGGMATPAFGDDTVVVRTSGRHLVVERGGGADAAPITTLAAAARRVGIVLDPGFRVGDETPPMVDPDRPLGVDDAAARALAAWWGLGTCLLDEIVATEEAVRASTPSQLWPEHFDVGCTVMLADARAGEGGGEPVRVNLGASPGDQFEPMPYLYVGPRSPDRPGDPGYWNAPFGAVLRHAEVASLPVGERRARALAFLRRGLALLIAP